MSNVIPEGGKEGGRYRREYPAHSLSPQLETCRREHSEGRVDAADAATGEFGRVEAGGEEPLPLRGWGGEEGFERVGLRGWGGREGRGGVEPRSGEGGEERDS